MYRIVCLWWRYALFKSILVLFFISTLQWITSVELSKTNLWSAVTPVFVQKGEDVVLNVTIADVPEEDTVTWKFNKTVNLVRFLPGKEPKVSDDYSGRIELLEKYSVKLKNLQEADSGVYIAVVSGDREKQITGYKITVQGEFINN
uniref:Immunoglobulin domain-containing protein n=1 Tax=Sander lucioperca TaxID=283035 RepID=A0A8C9ZWE5_SANLU